MQSRLVTIFFLILLCLSCTTAHIEHEVRQPDGQPFPEPYYTLQTTDPNTPIRASFFYSSIQVVKDLDQSDVSKQKFVDRKTHYFFSRDHENDLKLTVRVLNPRNMKYKVYCNQSIKFDDGGRMDLRSQLAYSDMKYREFSESLPTWKGVKEVTYSLEITNDSDALLIPTGKFHYYVSK